MRGYSLLRRLKRDRATIRTWVSVRYNGGVRSSGVSVKRGSTVVDIVDRVLECGLVNS